ncbi:hydrolase [Microbacterium phage Cece]|nr:hydrolase [Microbacterium phage Cece]UVG35344.1 hydrolase [Microbacterium phage Cece]
MADNKTTAAKAKAKTSVSPEPEEPTQESATAGGAEPAARVIAHNAVVGAGDTDTIHYSKARVPGPTEGRKSVTVLHIQRRLADEGFSEAASAPGGRYEALTTLAVSKYQESLGAEPTGVLTRAQFEELFRDDPNVSLVQDTVADH